MYYITKEQKTFIEDGLILNAAQPVPLHYCCEIGNAVSTEFNISGKYGMTNVYIFCLAWKVPPCCVYM